LNKSIGFELRSGYVKEGFATIASIREIRVILKNAVQPRINTDGHGYQAFTENQRFPRRENKLRLPKSVFIRVHLWLMTASSDSNRGI
jgi:hypothetical protein